MSLIPDTWRAFTAALPPNLYAKLKAHAEAEGVDVLTEAAYLLAYGLDNAPRPSEATLEPLTDSERDEALQVRMRMGALAVRAAQKEKT
jgi:hypothetical protein